MALAEEAMHLKRLGDIDASMAKLADALQHEEKAVHSLLKNHTEEPTRSIILQSAASLALDCGNIRRCEQLAGIALSGSPPQHVLTTLRDLIDRANFERHLDVQGITLEPSDVQLVIAGLAIAPGFADSSEITKRIDIFQKMVYRVAESEAKEPYRLRGQPATDLKHQFRVYQSIPRAASFAVTLRIARDKDQGELPTGPASSIASEVLDRLDLYSSGDHHQLSKSFSSEAYTENFVELAKSLEPDGDSVRVVGFTTSSSSGERRVKLIKTETNANQQSNAPKIASKELKLKGRIVLANSRDNDRPYVILQEPNGEERKLKVPAHLLERAVSYIAKKSKVTVNGFTTNSRTVNVESIRALPNKKKSTKKTNANRKTSLRPADRPRRAAKKKK